MIGGIIVRVGDVIYDASIATQLTKVRQDIIDRSVHEIQNRRDCFRNPERIEQFELHVDIREVGRVVEVGDGIAQVYGLSGVMSGEMVQFPHDVIS